MHHGSKGKTLLLASLSLPSAGALAAAARKREWRVRVLDESARESLAGGRAFYGGVDTAARHAAAYDLGLIEPPLDLLSHVPYDLLWRDVRSGTLGQVSGLSKPSFVKPADPMRKSFDTGVYESLEQLLGSRPLDLATPVLVSEPVEWTAEFRCFIADGHITAWSPYLSFGKPIWKAGGAGELPPNLAVFCARLFDRMAEQLPPAFVVDIGVLEDGRWAAVEFNPAWCSGILGADVEGVLKAIERATGWIRTSGPRDRVWMRKMNPGGSE